MSRDEDLNIEKLMTAVLLDVEDDIFTRLDAFLLVEDEGQFVIGADDFLDVGVGNDFPPKRESIERQGCALFPIGNWKCKCHELPPYVIVVFWYDGSTIRSEE